jgi:hypothetical protein
MVLNLLTYVILIFVAITAFWFSAHLIGLDGPRNGPSGLAWLDAEDAFDRVRQQHRRHRLAAALHRQPHRHRGGYYVSDGHHRVAAVRALGETSIAAHLTEVLWQPFPWQPFPSPHPGGTGLPDPPSPRDRDLPPPGPAGADHNLPRPGQARTVQWRATKPSGQAGVGALLR